MSNKYQNINLNAFLNSIPKEVIEFEERKQNEENQRVFEEFVSCIKEDKCFLCGCGMSTIDENNPCFHWFAHPTIKKKLFDKYLSQPISYFKLSGYLKWLANYEKPLVNINDLSEDISSTCFSESTIKYKNIEWSFSLGKTDYTGHNSNNASSLPHYHIQIKRDGNVFIAYNNYHILFADEDLFYFEMMNQNDMIFQPYAGDGLSILEEESILPEMIENLSLMENEQESGFRLQTFIDASENPIQGQLIVDAIEESRKTGQPMQVILKRLIKEGQLSVKCTTVLSTHNQLPKAKRSGKK